MCLQFRTLNMHVCILMAFGLIVHMQSRAFTCKHLHSSYCMCAACEQIIMSSCMHKVCKRLCFISYALFVSYLQFRHKRKIHTYQRQATINSLFVPVTLHYDIHFKCWVVTFKKLVLYSPAISWTFPWHKCHNNCLFQVPCYR